MPDATSHHQHCTILSCIQALDTFCVIIFMIFLVGRNGPSALSVD